MAIRKEVVKTAINKADALINKNIHNNIDKQYDFRKQTIFSDETLTSEETSEVLRILTKHRDKTKLLYNEGSRRRCENCNEDCLAISYCENCVRKFLKNNFSNWTSGSDDIDKLIQNCQLETLTPYNVVEWIPYDTLENIKYMTKGGYSEIYSADWDGGKYYEWDSKDQSLKRKGTSKVILKKLKNIENASKSWFEEAKSYFIASNNWKTIVKYFGITQDSMYGNYILVMKQLDIDLRKYLQKHHKQLKWGERMQIMYNIINTLHNIHGENIIHKDLHSGNVLYLEKTPEVIYKKEYTLASDIYSIGMLMWEISSGRPPFSNHEHDYNLAIRIVNGQRPETVLGTPSGYRDLMEQCWDANPLKRPDIDVLLNDIREIKRSYYENNHQESENLLDGLIDKNSTLNIKDIGSKLYTFNNIPMPKNIIIEDNDELYNNPNLHSEDQDELEIPDDIEDTLSIPNDVKNDNDDNNNEPEKIQDEDSESNISKKRRNCSSINVLKDIITKLTKKKPKKSKLKITYY
ncbi:kinase-like domain-containing protein [Rhizophagus clarus]|uniref:Kinase-like domain-containing protein n=1 Tax=Rhizophagus clarus TaxID=94130 RepID=A0A8H3M5T8_9GLOM|nr:kinase-like domain-containing protein [Rhizophagus clarus]